MTNKPKPMVKNVSDYYKCYQQLRDQHKKQVIEYPIDSRQYLTTYVQMKEWFFYSDCLIILTQMVDGKVILGYALETDGFPIVERRVPKFRQSILLDDVQKVMKRKTQLQLTLKGQRGKQVWRFRFQDEQIVQKWRKLLQDHIGRINSLYFSFTCQNQKKNVQTNERQQGKIVLLQFQRSVLDEERQNTSVQEIDKKLGAQKQNMDGVLRNIDLRQKLLKQQRNQEKLLKLRQQLALSKDKYQQIAKLLENLQMQQSRWEQKQRLNKCERQEKEVKIKDLMTQNDNLKMSLKNMQKERQQEKVNSNVLELKEHYDIKEQKYQLNKHVLESESTQKSFNSQIIQQNSCQIFKKNWVFEDISQIRSNFRKMSYQQLEKDTVYLSEQLNVCRKRIQNILNSERAKSQYLKKIQKQHQKDLIIMRQRLHMMENEKRDLNFLFELVSQKMENKIKELVKQNCDLKQRVKMFENQSDLLLNVLNNSYRSMIVLQESQNQMKSQNFELKFKRCLLESTLSKYSVRSSLIL